MGKERAKRTALRRQAAAIQSGVKPPHSKKASATAPPPKEGVEEFCQVLRGRALRRGLNPLQPGRLLLGAVPDSRSDDPALVEGCREMYRQTHPSTEGWIILSGRYRIEIEGRFSMLKRGDCVILPPGVEHAHYLHPTDGYVALGWSVFPLNVMFYITQREPRMTHGRRHGDQLLPRSELPEVEVVERLTARSRHWSPDQLARHAGRCILLLFDAASAILSHRRPWTGDRNTRMERKMEAVKELIHQRYYQDLALASIARSVGYSPAYCCNVFSQKEKMSPMAYLSKVRLDAAAKLLAETDLLVKEIAARAGFQSANYFVRRFRRVFGMTPLSYRASSAG